MSHKHRKTQPVTRREVLRIVQRARDDILSAIVHGQSLDRYNRESKVFLPHLADVEPAEAADG